MRLFLALALTALPGLALAGGGPFSLPDLTYPEDPAPTAQGCTNPAGLATVCTQPAG
ncbi:MAG: hypothetical protein JNN06_12570 [Gemmobacter sp.]|uniref:hypothetical protein n=1 Tax=Gemmobacter sp. TaxID=1898957 RepID=UPI001A5BD4BB|nr:hypothetical protein [Gemmobacter sp.]MBL8563103.1 hypothetical protein [Gemmobacter sp.]